MTAGASCANYRISQIIKKSPTGSNGSGSRGKRIGEKTGKPESLWHCPFNPVQLTSECTRHHGVLILPHLPILLVSITMHYCRLAKSLLSSPLRVHTPPRALDSPHKFDPALILKRFDQIANGSPHRRSPSPSRYHWVEQCEQVLLYLYLSSVIADLTCRQNFHGAGSVSGIVKVVSGSLYLLNRKVSHFAYKMSIIFINFILN